MNTKTSIFKKIVKRLFFGVSLILFLILFLPERFPSKARGKKALQHS